MNNNKEDFEFIENFLDRDGISGFERDIANAYTKIAIDSNTEIDRDGFGSVIAKKGSVGPKIMISSHMDEVGFLVTRIEKTGFLRVAPLGGIWIHTILATKIKVRTKNGKEYLGVMGSTSVHMLTPKERSTMMKGKDLFIDLGVKNKKEVEKLGIQIGDEVIRVSKSFSMANDDFYCGKAVDNRISVAITAKILQKLKNINSPNQLFAVATVQEEVGCRGARVASQHIRPDVAITIDTTTSMDTPNLPEGVNILGAGAAITIADSHYIANPMLCDMLMEIAKLNKIPAYRFVSTAGGNDSSETQWAKGGIPVVTIGVPTRYMHTNLEVGSITDFNAVVNLVVEFVKMFNESNYKKLLYKKMENNNEYKN